MEKIVSPIFSVPLRFEKERKKYIHKSDVYSERSSYINAFRFEKKILLIRESSSGSFFKNIEHGSLFSSKFST